MNPQAPRRTLLLVHAWGESARSFDRLIELLPPSLVPVAIDLPGGDVSGQADSSDYSVKKLADHVTVTLRAMNPSRRGPDQAVVVLGSSSGGYVAQQVAIDYPELVDALVLVGSPITLAGRPAFADDVDRLTDPVSVEWVREFFAWFPLHQPVATNYIDDRIQDACAISAQIWRDSLVGLYEATPPLETGRITTPTLVIGGGNDDLLGSTHDDLTAAIPNSRLVVYEETGHLVLWERPERIATDVAAFIETLHLGG